MRTTFGVKQEVLILSDGQSNCGGDAIEAAKSLQEVADVTALIIGHQSASGIAEMTAYVSPPVNSHLFVINGFNELKIFVDFLESKIQNIQCAPFDLSK